MTKTLRELAEEEEQLPDGHPEWQHVALGWQALAIAQSEKIIELEQELKSMTDAKNGFQSALARANAARSKP
ncbi:hypothetical protein [Vreelandella venusta]|uniref:hypothetical protein n=1 Tax=Vreelandella venusta TaxID=44935 RepID=UPI00200E133C|nr:hypothetical protein [Halomonas venusta]UQI42698.1 hypothetical protein M3L73_10730 [Halomonas venusta]